MQARKRVGGGGSGGHAVLRQAANMPVAASLARETGAFAVVDPLSAEMAVRLGGVVHRPVLQSQTYNIAIITHGRDTLSHEAQELAETVESRILNASA